MASPIGMEIGRFAYDLAEKFGAGRWARFQEEVSAAARSLTSGDPVWDGERLIAQGGVQAKQIGRPCTLVYDVTTDDFVVNVDGEIYGRVSRDYTQRIIDDTRVAVRGAGG